MFLFKAMRLLTALILKTVVPGVYSPPIYLKTILGQVASLLQEAKNGGSSLQEGAKYICYVYIPS